MCTDSIHGEAEVGKDEWARYTTEVATSQRERVDDGGFPVLGNILQYFEP
jgi:hypothetical protein